VTTIPLLFFGAAARQLRLSTMGILQYLSPTLQFLLAVVAFRESFSTAQIVSFGCIWTAIAIYTADSCRAVRRDRMALVEPFGVDP
jgi:chloramphenicol-sensitive protein RarD